MYKNKVEQMGIKYFLKVGANAFAICVIVLLCLFLLLPCFDFGMLEVKSDSMLPEFSAGDYLLIKQKKEIGVGDVICFDGGVLGLVSHRVVEVKERSGQKVFLCCGDANVRAKGYKNWQELSGIVRNCNFEDCSVLVDNVVYEREIKGVVVCKFLGLGKVVKIVKIITFIFIFGLIINLINKNKINKKLKK